MIVPEKNIDVLRDHIKTYDADGIIRHIMSEYGQRAVIASSLSIEDQVLLHMAITADKNARIFTLDTGRLNQETYDVMDETRRRYDMRFEVFAPHAEDIEAMENEHGPNLFRESVEKRKQCCSVRKVKPLSRVLGTADIWITGMRREQAVTRSLIETVEWDEANGLIKVNPLADWTTEMVWSYINDNNVPYNRLYSEGYTSIGCACCTRAIQDGEDARAGRWWWENPEHKECGLHFRSKK
ncbi:MAG: phosphoadenylyl-sulfate reductase [Spirochaetes bacterium]|nr:phosphoadenylyl-sulfate reductase [Spirochaetota bacterium]